MSEQKHQPRRYVKKSGKKADSRLMEERGEKRSGSESNAHHGRKQSRLHEHHQDENAPLYARPNTDFVQDLNPADQAGENHGENLTLLPGTRSADEIKHMHTILADLTDDELKSITVLPAGTHLEQGAKYIDLMHLEQGEFVATSDMVAEVDKYYVPKKETDYVLWNRLHQIDLPARIDETS
jgi:hypothetical protein